MSETLAAVTPREEFVTVTGCRTFVMRGGEGPPLLFLHGAGGGGIWQPWMARLARTRTIIAPEMPGFGRSDTPEWFETIHDVAYFVLDLMEALDIGDAQVVGASLGGWIAAEAAVRSTERMAGLTLIGPSGLHVRGVPKPDMFLWTPEEAVRAMYHDQRLAEAILGLPVTEEAIDRSLKNRFAAARLMWAPRGFDPHLEKWLHRIRIPGLVVWGAQDALLAAGPYSERWGALLPRATVRVIEACGHMPQLEQAGRFCDLLESFIAGSVVA
ncbi:MAG: alpha/beta fold hydrolase [Acetobacteraceae bacterium]|nr:alpha/beta fold hydrolase [Acetobacteraceae bacterium]